MTKSELIKYMYSPERLNEKTIENIGRIKQEYPYFQTAHLLSIKNLHNISSPDFNNKLHLTAAYVTDRRILYELIHFEKQVVDDMVMNRTITEDLKENIAVTVKSQLTGFDETEKKDLDFIQVSIDIRKEYGNGIELEDHDLTIHNNEEISAIKISDLSESTENFEVSIPKAQDHDFEAPVKGSILQEDIPVEEVPVEQENTTFIQDKEDEVEKTEAFAAKDDKEDNSELLILEDKTSTVNLIEEKNTTEDVPEIIENAGIIEKSDEIEFDLEETGGADSASADFSSSKENTLKDEEHTFTDWLKIVDNPNKEEKSILEEEKKKKNSELIDKFIQSAPKKITPPAADTYIQDVSVDSIKEHDGYITDTLAKVYIRQGYFSKAIFAYEKLILKYPEKSNYFAGQIEEIKKIIKNL